MTDEEVEVVARAIARNKRGPLTPDDVVDRVWGSYCGQARAAITALDAYREEKV